MASTATDRPQAAPPPPPQPEPELVPPWRSPRLVGRVGLLSGILLVVFAALFLRLWALQVLSGTTYVQQAASNSYRAVPVAAPRGTIVDRNGMPLVVNSTVTEIQLWPSDLPKVYDERFDVLRRLAEVTRVPLYEIARAIKKRAGDPLAPVVVRRDANEQMVAYLSERASEFPGVTTGKTYIRRYPYGSLAAQLLGYVGAIDRQQLKALGRGYNLNDEVGQSGVESAFDSYLRGTHGSARRNLDAFGRPRSALQATAVPRQGQTVRLTLSLKLQRAAEQALREGIALARSGGQWAANGGSIVALDPRDGSVLAMASYPTYDPSVFAGRVKEKKLAASGLTQRTAAAKNYPALNRATMVTYPPGSTFKPVTALAAMQEHLVTPYGELPCTPTYVSPDDRSRRPFKNWDPTVNRPMNLPTALAYSCDTYFYRLANAFFALPEDRGQPLQAWARTLGFGARTGIDVGPEAPGLVPTIDWRKRRFSKANDPCCWEVDQLWKPGNSIQLAIGQGDLLVTPLQMARLYAYIANGGKLVTPRLLMEVTTQNGSAVPLPARPAPTAVGDPGALGVIRQGLWQATHLPFGTSYSVFGRFPVSIAGKTGTAEKVVSLPGFTGLADQSWWCGYGPTSNPELAVCAVIENGGHGGAAAAPAAAKVFASYFGVDVKPKPITADQSD